jgi:hypothetical protein
MAVVYVLFLQTIFEIELLRFVDWVLVVVISSPPLLVMGLIKVINKKFRFINMA